MSITNKLNQIKNAIYGKEVRGAIHDAIKQVYDDASVNHDNANMEVKMARGTHNTLNDRLDNVDEIQTQTNAHLSQTKQELDGKINSNGVGEVTWANLAQDARENISGNKVAVVGENSVGTVNVIDASITSAKRTNIGEWGFIQGKYGKCELDLENRRLILPPGSINRYVTFRNENFEIPSGITYVDVSFGEAHEESAGFIFFDTKTKTFKTGGINVANEFCVFIGFAWWGAKQLVPHTLDEYYQPEPIYSINGLEEDNFFGQQAQLQFSEIMTIDFNHRKLIMPSTGFYVAYKNVNKFISNITEVDLSCGKESEAIGCFVFFDPKSESFVTTEYLERVKKRCLYIGFIWWGEKRVIPYSNGQLYQPEPIYMLNSTVKSSITQTHVNGRYGILNSASPIVIDLCNKKIKFSNPVSFSEVYDGFNSYSISQKQKDNGIDIDFKENDNTDADAGYIYFNTDTGELEYKTKYQSIDQCALLNHIFLGVIFSNGQNTMLNFSNYRVENHVNVLEHSKWKGKVVNILGDSITEGKGTTIKYADSLAASLGCTVRNYGISGSTISSGSGSNTGSNPMDTRFADMDDNADGIIVFGGTNDFGWRHTPLGNINDNDKTTFYGSLKTLIEGLINKYPLVPIMFITPLHRADGDGDGENTPNIHGKKLVDYVNAIKEVCELYSIKVCDLWSKSGIQPNLPIHKDLYTSKTTGYPEGDGLHPNEIGNKKITPIIVNDFNDLL